MSYESGADAALNSMLEPIYRHLEGDNITELSYNGSGDISFLEQLGVWTKADLNAYRAGLTHALPSIATMIASHNSTNFDNKFPLLSGTLPNGYRIQMVHADICRTKNPAFSIRKPPVSRFSHASYRERGAYDNIAATGINKPDPTENDIKLMELYKAGKFYDFVELAVVAKKNIILSGATGSGKTSYFNSLLGLIPLHERLIAIEDTRETDFPHENSLYLVAPKNNKAVSFGSLLAACLRLRPDRIMASEIREDEALAYLTAINTGHPGSISTIHADNTSLAFFRLYLMLQKSGIGLAYEDTYKYMRTTIDIVVQVKDKKPCEIWYDPSAKSI